MFTSVQRISFKRARGVGMGLLSGFVLLGTGASLSPAANTTETIGGGNLPSDWSLAPSVHNFFNAISLPEPATPWFFSVAGGLCLLILVRRKAQL
jgi:hypothetical protein